MRKHLRRATLLALTFAAPLAAQEDPAALVVRLQGDVQVRHGASAPAAAAVGERLLAGDEVLPSSGARAILITRTGAQQVITEATTVAEPRGGGNPDMFARAMRTLAQAASADARNAGGRQGMIRPIPGEPVLVAPRNGLTVTSTRPTFSWLLVDDAPGYVIQIRRVDGGRPMRFETTPNHWTLPDDTPALIPGAEYAWTVAPLRGRPTREARFKVIGPEEYAEMAATLGQVIELGLDPADDGLFLSAVVYRDLDLFYEAAAALDGVEMSGALTPELYLLKGEILNQLGQADLARAAFDRADEMMR